MKFWAFNGRGITICNDVKFMSTVGILNGLIVEPETPGSQPYFRFRADLGRIEIMYDGEKLYHIVGCKLKLTKSDQYLLDLKLEEVLNGTS